MTKLAVFASGTGSNFEVIADTVASGELKAELVLMVCDVVGAPVVEKARKRGIDVLEFNPKSYASKAEYEAMIVAELQKREVDLIALAGYMRILRDTMLSAYEGRIVNIHPSLLPAFMGKDAIGQAIRYGVKVMGVTIHYVDSGMDSGKIIAQEAFKVESGMSHEEIEARVHGIEHKLYTKTLSKLIEEMEA